MEPKLKFFYPPVKAIDRENRSITVCISKDEIDRHGERVEINAIAESLKIYAINPVVLGDHQHRLPTGKSSVIGHSPPESFKVSKDSIEMDILFSVNENAETYWVNYRDGHQRAVSIGFMDTEWRYEESNGKKISVITKLELYELSCVAVGANRGALIKQKDAFDVLAVSDGQELQPVISKQIADLKTFVEDSLDEVKSLLIPGRDGFAKGLLGGPPDSSAPDGDKISEQKVLEALAKALKTVFQ